MLRRAMAAAAAALLHWGSPAEAGQTLDGVRQRGILACGVSTGIAGFSLPDPASSRSRRHRSPPKHALRWISTPPNAKVGVRLETGAGAGAR